MTTVLNKRTQPIANDVRALRTPQAIPVHDGEEVHDVCLS